MHFFQILFKNKAGTRALGSRFLAVFGRILVDGGGVKFGGGVRGGFWGGFLGRGPDFGVGGPFFVIFRHFSSFFVIFRDFQGLGLEIAKIGVFSGFFRDFSIFLGFFKKNCIFLGLGVIFLSFSVSLRDYYGDVILTKYNVNVLPAFFLSLSMPLHPFV